MRITVPSLREGDASQEGWAQTTKSALRGRLDPTCYQLMKFMDHMAGRIEQAYGLRRPRWLRGCSTSRVWYTAALRLWESHTGDPVRVPLDPELFVASQPISAPFSDPWSELAHPESARRYRSAMCGGSSVSWRAELRRERA